MLTSRTVLREKRSTRYPAGTPAIAMPSVNTVASSPPACRLIPYSWRIVGRSGAKIWRSAALIMKDTARTRNPTATTSAGTLGSARCALPPAAPTSAGTGLIGTASTGTTSMGTATMGIVYLSVGTVYVSVDTAGDCARAGRSRVRHHSSPVEEGRIWACGRYRRKENRHGDRAAPRTRTFLRWEAGHRTPYGPSTNHTLMTSRNEMSAGRPHLIMSAGAPHVTCGAPRCGALSIGAALSRVNG